MRKLSTHMPANEMEAKIQKWIYGSPLGPITPLPKEVATSTPKPIGGSSTKNITHIEITISGIRVARDE